jgi:peptide/nickel transport system substrate-binding protein
MCLVWCFSPMQSLRDRYSVMDRLLGLIEGRKLSDRILLRVLFFVMIGSGLYYLISLNNSFTISTPTRGGTLVEGIVGIPRFVNPALALTRADQDSVALIYSGLMKINPDGTLVPDIAEKIEVSEDGTTYHVFVRKDRAFHDGTPLTARDVLFTYELIRDPDLKSPLRGNWSDVTLESINEYEFTVTLQEPYTPFIENFAVGIMPSHIWSNLPIEQLPFSQYNTEPVGSGPFMVNKVNRDASGLISGYLLRQSSHNIEEPNLSAIELKFYQNESDLSTALKQGDINATVFLPAENIKQLNPDDYTVITEPLPRVFAIFINQNRSVPLRDKAARQALSAAIDRQAIIDAIFGGYGVPIDEPIVTEQRGVILEDTVQEGASSTPRTPTEILEAGGWKRSTAGSWEKKIGENTETLAVTIKTGNSAPFETAATLIAENWRQLGVEVQVEQYEQTGLVQSVIRSRDFQALFFGIDMNRLQDLYPFWHSSQKDDPGLNIAQYTNVSVDRLLETARTSQDETEQTKTLAAISTIITDEVPAIFLFAPSITYVTDSDLTVASMKKLGRPADRFMNISNWYARTDTVWPIFQNKN